MSFDQKNPISESELKERIMNKIESTIEDRLQLYNETSAKLIDKKKKERIQRAALFLYTNSEPITSLSQPESRLDAAVHDAYIEVVFDNAFIHTFITSHLDSLKRLYRVSSRLNEQEFISILVNHVTKKRNQGHYFDFDESVILFFCMNVFIELLQEKYGVAISYDENAKNEERRFYSDVEERIYIYFQQHISFNHDGAYPMEFSSFPTQILRDVGKYIELGTDKNLHFGLEKAYASFMESILVEAYPLLEQNEEIKMVFTSFYEQSQSSPQKNEYECEDSLLEDEIFSLFADMVEEDDVSLAHLPATFMNDIYAFMKKSEAMPFENLIYAFVKEQYIHAHSVLMLTKDTAFSLGEIVDYSHQFRCEGYSYVIGFVGNRLFLSEKELPLSLDTLHTLSNDYHHTVAINGKVYKLFCTKKDV